MMNKAQKKYQEMLDSRSEEDKRWLKGYNEALDDMEPELQGLKERVEFLTKQLTKVSDAKIERGKELQAVKEELEVTNQALDQAIYKADKAQAENERLWEFVREFYQSDIGELKTITRLEVAAEELISKANNDSNA